MMTKPEKRIEILDENNITKDEAETLFQYLLGDEINNHLTALYHGRGVDKLTFFRVSLRQAIEIGGFTVDSVDKVERNGNDENWKNPTYRRIKALCGADCTQMIVDLARCARIGNLACLRQGMRNAISRMAL